MRRSTVLSLPPQLVFPALSHIHPYLIFVANASSNNITVKWSPVRYLHAKISLW